MTSEDRGWGRHLRGDAIRFVIAGVANTGLTLVVYQVLLFALSPSLAYIAAWLAGLVFVAMVYPDKVFKGGRQSAGDRLLLAVCYCAVFLSGLLLLQALQALGHSPRLAIFVVIITTTLINFFLSRGVLRR